MRYSPELKEAVLRRILPPNNESIAKVAREEGLPEQTIRTWRERAIYIFSLRLIVSLKRVSAACDVGLEWLQYGDDSKKEFPVNDKLIDWLWKHKEVREALYKQMKEE